MIQSEFKFEILAGHQLFVLNVSGHYTINRVTDKAILIECDNGKWIDDGKFIPMWIPKSLLNIVSQNDNKQNTQTVQHQVMLPEWFINKNAKTW